MAKSEGLALAPWGALGGGKFTTEQKRAESDTGRNASYATPSAADIAVSKKLEEIANKRNTAITSIALAYVRAKYAYVFPIVGGRKIEHLKGNIEALAIELSDEEVSEIEGAVDFDVGFPMDMMFTFGGGKYSSEKTAKDIGLLGFAGNLEEVRRERGPKAHGLEGYGKN
jgi:diketogulonate reductase-like aldo/keto reductase